MAEPTKIDPPTDTQSIIAEAGIDVADPAVAGAAQPGGYPPDHPIHSPLDHGERVQLLAEVNKHKAFWFQAAAAAQNHARGRNIAEAELRETRDALAVPKLVSLTAYVKGILLERAALRQEVADLKSKIAKMSLAVVPAGAPPQPAAPAQIAPKPQPALAAAAEEPKK